MPNQRHNPKDRPFRISSCACPDCCDACTNSPGWFMPTEITRLAEYLGLSLEETFRKKLAVGVTNMPGNSLRHGIMPHKLRDGKKPGSLWSLDELSRPGRCVFYDQGRCSIHPVRPFECARMIHGPDHDSVQLRHTIVEFWDDKTLAPFAKLTGRRLFGKSKPKGPRPRPRSRRNK